MRSRNQFRTKIAIRFQTHARTNIVTVEGELYTESISVDVQSEPAG